MPPPAANSSGNNAVVLRSSSNKNKKKLQRISIVHAALVCFTCTVLAFYAGMMLGASTASSSSHHDSAGTTSSGNKNADQMMMIAQLQQTLAAQQRIINEQQQNPAASLAGEPGEQGDEENNGRFPTQVADVVVGMARIPRDDFATTFDMGVPLDATTEHNAEVLLLYATDRALPHHSDPFAAVEATSGAPGVAAPLLSAATATENCDFLHVILTDHSRKRRQCLALFGQYEAFHIQKWMRLPVGDDDNENIITTKINKGKLNASLPLTLVNRGAQASGRRSTRVPTPGVTRQYWSILQTYLASREDVLQQLRPIAERVAVNNTIIVLVCNLGQSELLLNFLCSSLRRGIELKGIVVFATDQETFDLITALNDPHVGVFFDEVNFGDMPKHAARRYADATFMRMMMAKVFCVQMISTLGYDLLFQDVDVIWYQNPLSYFHNPRADDAHFDVYFQDDGNHALFYAPYSANTGFYYVRNNERTQYFFNAFLMAGDLIIMTKSHQIPLVALLQEHASMYALRVKIFSRDSDTFPGGHAFHRRFDFMRDLIAAVKKTDELKKQGRSVATASHNNLIKPYIFHMSWTSNKENKRKFFQQMGEWYVHDQCLEKSVKQLGIVGDQGQGAESLLVAKCCAAEPLVSCHYKDKPSKIPCKDSPPIDKGHASFW
jgi:Nucleotide-diphospho-sugar transferase